MRVDKIEIESALKQSFSSSTCTHCKRERRNRHPDLWNQTITWMPDVEPIAMFLRWRLRHDGVLAKSLMHKWKPRHRRNDSRLYLPRFDYMS